MIVDPQTFEFGTITTLLSGVKSVVLTILKSVTLPTTPLTSTTSSSVINALKAIFSRHGIPSEFVSDNGPQFDSREMKEFASKYNFIHTTSSPHYPQSNGLAERTVKTVKKLIADSPDPHLALLSYRSTPLPWCELSPAELLMGRRLQTDVPQTKTQLIPNWPHIENF